MTKEIKNEIKYNNKNTIEIDTENENTEFN